MKTAASLLLVLLVLVGASCSKSNKAQNVSGTINGKPALTLYGSSNKPADYLLLGEDSTARQMSYNGIVLTYSSTTPPAIFMLNGGLAIAKGTLVTGSSTTLTIDTSYGFSFGSKEYSSR